MPRPATVWVRGAGERTDLDAPDCAPEDCPPVAPLTGTIWLGDGLEPQPIEPECPEPDCVGGGGGGQPLLSDAILKPRSLYYNSYDLGSIQGLRRDVNADPNPYWIVMPSGGRDGGGYAKSVKNVNPTGGSMTIIPISRSVVWGVPEDHPWGAGCVIAFNLFGQALLAPMNCIAIMARHASLGDGADLPQVVISVRPDRTLQASILDPVTSALIPITNGVDTAISTVTVPADGWFALEPQVGISLAGNDESGFVILQLYTEGGPPGGVEAFKILNCKTRTQSSSDCYGAYAYGSEVVAALGPGLDNIGADDVHLYGHYGTVKRFMYDTFVGTGLPESDGDTIQSTVAYDSTHPSLLAADHALIGGPTVHGVSPRVNNLSGGPTRPDLDEHAFPPADDENPAPGSDWIAQEFDVGLISPFTGIWLDGPHVWALPEITRNTFNDNAEDNYRLRILRGDVAEVVGVQPITAVAQRVVRASDGVAGGGSESFDWVGLHGLANIEANALLRVGLRLGGVTELGRYYWNPQFGFGGHWSPLNAYTTQPYGVHERSPLGSAFAPADLAALQMVLKGDRSLADLDGDPARHWVQFGAIQAGIEFAYRKALVVFEEHAPFPPIARLVLGTALLDPLRELSVQDVSVDWDGTIVSRVIDWGDGSPTELLAGSSRTYMGEGTIQPSLTHTYAGPGSFTVTLTVTDNDGLVSVKTYPVVVPNQPPVADFTFAADPGDPTFQTVDFTDASSDPDGSIASWDWDFGDGSPHSTLQNPVHVYATPGTRSVILVVTDNLGATDSQSHNVTTPLGGPARVKMPVVWADSMGAAGQKQSTQRWDFTGGSEVLVAGGGRDGNDCVKEGNTFGVWQYTFIGVNPHAFQFGFDLQGQALPVKELPLFMVGNQNVAVVLRPDGKVRVYALDAGFVWQQVLETAAAVPGTGPVVGQLRFKFGAAGAGFVRLWINGETLAADPVAVNPGGSLTMNGDTVTLGTGSAGNYNYAPAGGFATGLANTRWMEFIAMDDSGAALNGDQPGDTHVAICKPQAIGAFNDTGIAAASDMQSDDQATTETTFTATNQKDTLTVNTPTLVGTPTILSVLPYYQGFRGGVLGTRQLAVLCKSGATLAQSQTISSSSQWTARYHVIPADGADKWVLANDPNTAAPWANAAAIGATEVGLIAVAVNAGGTILLSQLGYEVLYWNT